MEHSNTHSFQIGVVTLGEHLGDPESGDFRSPQKRMAEIIDAAQLADEAGLDFFGVGEHHRLDYVVSAVPVVLGAIAQRTRQIRLTSAVTVLSTADPVREFENYATLDLVSQGRAEMIVGRGAFVESYALFGHDICHYDELFPENIDLLMKLNQAERVTWQGKYRPALKNAVIAPRPVQDQIPIWVGVGGSPQSVAATASLGLPMMLGIIGGSIPQFAPLMDYYRKIGAAKGWTPGQLQTGVTSYLHIAKDSQKARDEFYPYHAHYFAELSKDRGQPIHLPRAEFDRSTRPEGAFFVGSPQEIIDKILYQIELFGHQRFMAQVDIGGLPYAKVAQTIELLATEVLPAIRKVQGA